MSRLVTSICVVLMLAGNSAAQIPTPIPTGRTLQAQRDSIALDAALVRRVEESLWIPVRTQEQAKVFWATTSSAILSSGALMIEDKVFGTNIEMFSDIVGIFRVGIGVTAAAADDDEASDENTEDAAAAVSRLANVGGVVRFTASVPLMYRAQPEVNSTWAIIFTLIGGTEAPESGGFLEDPAVSAQAAVDLSYVRAGLNNRIDFEFGIDGRGYLFSDSYATKAAVNDEKALLVTPRIGFVLLERTKLSLLWRLVRGDTFEGLGRLAVTLQQTTG